MVTSELVLEVIESNARAVALYRRAGFETVRPLCGYTLAAGRPDRAAVVPVREVDPAVGAALAGRFGAMDLPWQLQIPSLASMVRPTRCFTDAPGSIVAMVDPGQVTVRLKALAFDPEVSFEDAAAFTASLRAAFPDRPWAAPPIFPEAHGARFFAPGGWATTEMRQLEMAHRLG